MAAPGLPAARKAPEVAADIEAGDHVYVNHPKLGAMAVRVLAKGADGFTAKCGKGGLHRVGYDGYLGHRSRLTHQYKVVEQGADGAILEGKDGKRRFVAGELPAEHASEMAAEVGPEADPPPPAGDPLLGGLDRLSKAQVPGGAARDLFAAPVAVKGHVRAGKEIAPHVAIRHKGYGKIKKVHRVHDTRQYEEHSDGKWHAIPGSGDARDCDRCGRSHEVHADVETESGHLLCVGTGCMDAESADVASRIKSATSAAKTARRLEHELAGGRARQADYDRHKAEVEKLELPGVERGETGGGAGLTAWHMGDAQVKTHPGREFDAERQRALTDAWRRNRMRERGHASQPHWSEEDLERRLSQARSRMNGAEPMAKAFPAGATVVFLKAAPIKNRPGLALQHTTDKGGHDTQRWVRTMKDQPAAEKGPAAMRHGDTVRFRHGDVEGSGRVVGSGRDGVTVHDGEREHQVRHEHLIGPAQAEAKPGAGAAATAGGAGGELAKPDYAPRNEGENDKAYAKRVVDKMDAPASLPEDHGRYFHTEGSETMDLDKMTSTKTDAENQQGGDNGPKRMHAAYHGVLGKREPIQVERQADGSHKVVDGNGTYTSAKKMGWKSLPVRVTNAADAGAGDAGKPGDAGKQAPAAPAAPDLGPEPAPLFKAEAVAGLPKKAVQPAKDEAGVYALGKEGLAHLQEWLDRDKGIAVAAGAQDMKCGPDEADMSKPGAMLFIAPLKGAKRAGEKVRDDYGGDWSKLLDVVRCSIACDTHEEVAGMLAKLRAGGLKLAQQPKDRFLKPMSVGYRDALLNVTLPNGCVAEVQLHVKAMIKAKSEGHHFYETQRVLDAKPADQWSDEDKAAYQDATDKQVAIYVPAWQSACGSKAGGDEAAPMKKAMAMAGEYKFFDHDNATFRKPADFVGGVQEVWNDVKRAWTPYKGNRTDPALYGDPCEDPAAGGAEQTDDTAEKAFGGRVVLFLKAE